MTRPINPAVTLAIDSGAQSGFAILGPKHLDLRWCGEVGEDDAETRLLVAQTALDLARKNVLPLVVAREQWTAGGPHANPKMFAGLGASWGWWQESIRLAVALSKAPRSLPLVHVRVYTQTWWAACIGGKKPTRDAALRVVRSWADRCYERDESSGPDEAVALAIGYWAQLAPDVSLALPKAAWRGEGAWLPPADPEAAKERVARARKKSRKALAKVIAKRSTDLPPMIGDEDYDR